MIELKGKYTKAKIFASTVEEGVISQVYDIINSKAFDGQRVVCMPDVHVGASGPCGLVATIGNYVCPEHIGVDIGCSVSMLVLDKKIPEDKYAEFESRVKTMIPFGFNLHQYVVVNMDYICSFLSAEFRKKKVMWHDMLADLPEEVTEEWITQQLKRIGISEEVFYKSLGTVGGGNHFIEYDEGEDMAGVTLHFGSRNFGKRVCEYWTEIANNIFSKEEIRQMIYDFKALYTRTHSDMRNFEAEKNAYIDSRKEGYIKGYLCGDNLRGYLCDMCFAQAYAALNHEVVSDLIEDILYDFGIDVERVIKSVHNYIDLEDHTLRKSAIRSYVGEEMLVPFNMRDGVAICEGLSNDEWLNSCAHGAGRKLSRSAARETLKIEDFQETMKDVYSTTVCEGTIDEAPMAYKDTEEIKDLIKQTCVVKDMLIPKINIKAVENNFKK